MGCPLIYRVYIYRGSLLVILRTSYVETYIEQYGFTTNARIMLSQVNSSLKSATILSLKLC